MGLKFRQDKDLSVLALASHGDLNRLGRVLTHDESDGEKRRAQELLDDPAFKKAQESGDLTRAWRSIAAELQAYGGDTIVNAARSLLKGHTGVVYREMLTDICGHLKLKIQPKDNIKGLELIRSQMDKFSAEDLTRILSEAAQGVGLKDSLAHDIDFDALARQIATDAHTSYLASLVVPAIASAALPFLARLSLPALMAVVGPRAGGALVPGLNVVVAASTLTLLTSPAYRVTLPAVLEVIRIRRVVLLATTDAQSAA
jgi:uncharacterized protein YaaW (UPF0174 family)